MKKIFLLAGIALFSGAGVFAQSSKSILPKDWYLQDKEQSLQKEFEALLDEWSGKTQTAKVS